MADLRRPEAAGIPVGTILGGRYQLDRKIAIGGMAEVWAGTDRVLRRPVAVKLLKPALLKQAAAVERFRREAVAAAKVRHPNVVAVYDTLTGQGYEAIVMELVEGISLRRRLDDQPRLPLGEVVAIATGVTRALGSAHQHGLVHRDIKPANILLSADGRVLLSDFGIAKGESGGEPGEPIDLTNEHVMLGTAKYLSPEQVTGHPLDGRSDLYALGAVLYESLTGRPPFLADDDVSTALARLRTEPVAVHRLRSDVPKSLEQLVHGLLARDAARRPDDASVVLDRLADLDVERRNRPAARRTEPRSSDPRPTPAPRTAARPARAADDRSGPQRVSSRPPATPARGQRPIVERDPTVEVPTDPTPRGSRLSRPQVNDERSRTPAVVGLLLLAAIVVTAVLLASSKLGTDAIRDNSGLPEAGSDTTVVAAPLSNDPLIVTVRDFDPLGDGQERPDILDRVHDNDSTMGWGSEQYKHRTLASKLGVGLILTVDKRTPDDVVVIETDMRNWAVQIFVSDTQGAKLSDWGDPVTQGVELTGTNTLSLGPTLGREILVWFTDPGDDGPPFWVRVGEIRVKTIPAG